MKRADLEIIERALSGQPITSEEAEQASETLGELRLRDWAVRVLDAWRLDEDAARLAAADAVWPTLDAATQAAIGERP